MIARRFDRNPRRWLGIIVGFGGVLVVMSGQAGGFVMSGQVIGLLSVLMSASMYSALGVFVSLRMTNKSSLHVTAVGMTWSALFSLPFALPSLLHGPLPASALANAAALGVIGGACGFGLFYYLLGQVGATRSAFVVYLMPIVAVILGSAVRQESITLTIIAGMILIISGIGVANATDDGFEQSIADQLEEDDAQRAGNAQPGRTRHIPAAAPAVPPAVASAQHAGAGLIAVTAQRDYVFAVTTGRLEDLLAAAQRSADPVELAALCFAAEIEMRVAHELLAEIAIDGRPATVAGQPHEQLAMQAAA